VSSKDRSGASRPISGVVPFVTYQVSVPSHGGCATGPCRVPILHDTSLVWGHLMEVAAVAIARPGPSRGGGCRGSTARSGRGQGRPPSSRWVPAGLHLVWEPVAVVGFADWCALPCVSCQGIKQCCTPTPHPPLVARQSVPPALQGVRFRGMWWMRDGVVL
jgi:hypothetical protein